MTINVRFAPSPTGALHIGGARTALFNWLFAKHHQGKFVLRIEDTDRLRSTKAHEQSILDGMKWLGLTWDDTPIYQSERDELYRQYIDQMIDSGHAYRCTCTADELAQKREASLKNSQKPKYDGTCRDKTVSPSTPHTVRFKAPLQGHTTFKDACRGSITFENKELDDVIIARTDGSATYNFTVVIDDATMNISHVIRGDDHINNTPRQVLLYKALGFDIPIFAHLPMIFGSDKKKLSKRHGATSVMEYQDMGYLPDAMVNYLSRLGWSHKDQEIFTSSELIAAFDLPGIGSSPSIFDFEKLAWVNSQHMANLSNSDIVTSTQPFLEKNNIVLTDMDYAATALATERERAKTFDELAHISAFYFKDPCVYDEKSVKKWLKPTSLDILATCESHFHAMTDWTEESIAHSITGVMEHYDVKMLKVAQPLRIAMTGTAVSPGIYEVLAILGKDTVIKRIQHLLAYMNNRE